MWIIESEQKKKRTVRNLIKGQTKIYAGSENIVPAYKKIRGDCQIKARMPHNLKRRDCFCTLGQESWAAADRCCTRLTKHCLMAIFCLFLKKPTPAKNFSIFSFKRTLQSSQNKGEFKGKLYPGTSFGHSRCSGQKETQTHHSA